MSSMLQHINVGNVAAAWLCRGASGSGADFRSGKLRRPPRAQSSGSGLRSTLLLDNQQLSFTDSVTNTTNSSETSPRRQWQAG